MTISCESFFRFLNNNNVRFFTQVQNSPNSTYSSGTELQSIGEYLEDHVLPSHHRIAPDDRDAIALASQHYFATSEVPLVYSPNFDFLNRVKAVPLVPMLLMIGWSGEIDLLQNLEIPYTDLSDNETIAQQQVESAVKTTVHFRSPAAILVRDGVFQKYRLRNNPVLSK